jgi:hypothetical protein
MEGGMQDDSENNFDRALDVPVWGAAAIGRVLNQSRRQAYHLLERRLVDADRIGGRWRSTPRRLLQPGDRTRSRVEESK